MRTWRQTLSLYIRFRAHMYNYETNTKTGMSSPGQLYRCQWRWRPLRWYNATYSMFRYIIIRFCCNLSYVDYDHSSSWAIVSVGSRWITTQIARFMWPTLGPPGSCRPQVGSMLAPWTLISGYLMDVDPRVFAIWDAYSSDSKGFLQNIN